MATKSTKDQQLNAIAFVLYFLSLSLSSNRQLLCVQLGCVQEMLLFSEKGACAQVGRSLACGLRKFGFCWVRLSARDGEAAAAQRAVWRIGNQDTLSDRAGRKHLRWLFVASLFLRVARLDFFY